jgi:hypothetical protein
MTATVGAESQEPRAAPPVPATAAQPRVEEYERRRQLLQALTTEHFTLQTARSATIADSNGRSAERSTCSPWPCCPPWSSSLRLVQTAVEDLFYARAINRIRRHYVDLDPEAARWFVLCGFDDPTGSWPPWAWPARGRRRHRMGICGRMPPPGWRW